MITRVERYPRPARIWRHYSVTIDALSTLESALDRSRFELLSPSSLFLGLAPREAEALLREARIELDAQTTLMLFASFEAEVMATYRVRRRWQGRKPLQRRLRSLLRGPRRPELDRILRLLRSEVPDPKPIERFLAALPHRHWLAHGRHFPNRSGLGPIDPGLAWELGSELLDALPFVEGL